MHAAKYYYVGVGLLCFARQSKTVASKVGHLLYVFRNTLQGLGNAIAPLISGVMEFFARVSVAYLFTSLFGDELIYFAEPSAWFAAMVVLITICLQTVHRLPRSKEAA